MMKEPRTTNAHHANIWAYERTKSEQLQHSVRATTTTKNISNLLSGYQGVLGKSEYQGGISSALTLNAIKTAPFNISVNALNESPTLFLHSPRLKKARHFVIESDSD